jgi:transcriptional regulator with XRE-family HTH domain
MPLNECVDRKRAILSEILSEPDRLEKLPKRQDGRERSLPQDVDRQVGARIRQRRIVLGIHQQQLAASIGVTNQQAHKYERGINRISAGRLFVIAQALGVDIRYFFEGLNGNRDFEPTPRGRALLELAQNFLSLPDLKLQAALSSLVRVLADHGGACRSGRQRRSASALSVYPPAPRPQRDQPAPEAAATADVQPTASAVVAELALTFDDNSN